MKTKIDVIEILDNKYFDFNDSSDFNFYVDGKTVSIDKLRKGVDINQEFSIETKNHCQFQYRDKNTFKPNYDARDIFQFGFKLVLNKIQFDLIEYWTCNGILRLDDDYVFDYMDTEDFKDGIKELIEIAEQKKVAYMCSEAVWWRCHRSMISDYLKAKDRTVMHIMAIHKADEHPYTAPAETVNGELSYPEE